MGQIIGRSAKPDACNIRSLSSFGIPAAGQHILVSTDNSAMQNGQGNFDACVVGDGVTAATALPLKKIDDVTDEDLFYIAGRYKDPVAVVTDSDFTGGSYIKANNTTASNSGFKYVQNVDISGYDQIIVYGLSQSAAYTVLLDENLGIIRSFHITTSPTTLYPKEEGAAYISHCCQNAQNGSIWGIQKELIPASETQDRLSALESDIVNKVDSSDYYIWEPSGRIDLTGLEEAGYINSSGAKASASGYQRVYQLDVSAYSRIRVWGDVIANAFFALYDSTGNKIRTWQQSGFTDIDLKQEGATYISICRSNSWYPQYGIEILSKTTDRSLKFFASEGYVGTNGLVTTRYSGYSSIVSNPYRVKEGDVFRVHGRTTAYGVVAIIFGSDFSILNYTRLTSYGEWATITIPSGGAYAIFASLSEYLEVYNATTLEALSERHIIDARGTWQALGTSITWYDKNPTMISNREDFRQGYVSWLQKNIYFSNFTNSGVNGGKVDSAISVVANADYYTIEHGVNDCASTPLGTIEDYINNADNGTFAANYRKLIDAIYTANINAKIIICTPLYTSTKTYDTFVQYVEMVKAIAHYEHLPVADFFYEANVNSRNIAEMTIGDNLHPNDEGHKRMASVLLEAFRKAIPPNKLLDVETGSSGE